ncbi:MAG: gamma-glutamyltransferase family protein [Zoogloeaceae bacterium]|nr:gamma-glutamyltransferase family protein [Zoogloeaceae bacterium]
MPKSPIAEFRLLRLLFLPLLLAFVASAHADRAAPEAATGSGAVSSARSQQAMVVTANAHATEAAVAVLHGGGSAVDAAVAAAMVLNVVEPQSAGIGGGAFMLHLDAGTGRLVAWDGRETAPAAADPSLFLREGRAMPFFEAVVGGLAVGPPGLLRMLEAAHREGGRLPWERLFDAAIELAEHGFAVSPRLHALLDGDRFLRDDPGAAALFYRPDGRAVPTGHRLRNPELAEVMRRVANEGADALHLDGIAHDIVAAVRREPSPGLLSEADLAGWRPVRREPLCGAYRRHLVCGMPPPSAGGAAVLSLLGVLQRFDLSGIDPDSAFVTHLFAEAGRLAYADRGAWYGDPASMTVTVDALLDARYLSLRAEEIALSVSMGRARAGRPGRWEAPGQRAPERPATTHVSIVDVAGNAVALTASIENAFGSRRMVRGFLLNNQLTDFVFDPLGEDGVPHPNRLLPGRRPVSSMAPTMVFDSHGRLYALLGSPGGSRIINYVAGSLVGLLDFGIAPEALAARPHAGSRNGPTEVEDTPAGRALGERLQAFGHETVAQPMTSGLALIVRDGEGWVGVADPRREGLAAGLSP